MPVTPTFFACAVLAVSACAHDIHARYPASPDEATGRLALVFTDTAAPVNVAVNGVLLVRGARTEKVVVRDVPTGYADVAVAVGPMEKQTRVWVDADRETTLPLGASGEAPLSALRGFALSLASIALYTLLR